MSEKIQNRAILTMIFILGLIIIIAPTVAMIDICCKNKYFNKNTDFLVCGSTLPYADIERDFMSGL